MLMCVREHMCIVIHSSEAMDTPTSHPRCPERQTMMNRGGKTKLQNLS